MRRPIHKSKRTIFILALLLCIVLHRVLIVPIKRMHTYPSAIVVHESASLWGDVKTIRGWHQHRGWSDIGYHAVILNGRRSKVAKYDVKLDGKIERGRPESIKGSHCEGEGMNSIALGVCLVGIPGKDGYPTKHQLDALIHYCTIKCIQYNIPANAITQHSDHDSRKPFCASLDMKTIRKRVKAELARINGE